jgi:ElaB/YqjD/DUF883 family membrane-anchored ribosome-binding protein
VTTKTENSVEDVKDDLTSLRKDVDKLLKALGHDAESFANEALDESRKRVKIMAKNAQKRGIEGLDAAEAQIEANPFTSIATAFGVGLIVGRLLGGK